MITPDGGGGTYPAPTSAQVDAVGGLLGLVLVDPATIAAIKAILEQSRTSIPAKALPETPPGAFGPSPTGAELGHHTDLAHQHVVKAMMDMLEGVNGFEVGLDTFVQDVTKSDENAEVMMRQILTNVEQTAGCTAGPTGAPTGDPTTGAGTDLPQCTPGG